MVLNLELFQSKKQHFIGRSDINTDEELEFALNKGSSCMTLLMRILSKKDMTMKELNEKLNKTESSQEEDYDERDL